MAFSAYGKQINSNKGCCSGIKSEANKIIYENEQKACNFIGLSEDNVELSVEVEIASSLKHLITSHEKNDPSLLDVTIVRPSDCSESLNQTVSVKCNEVKGLIAALERQNRHNKQEWKHDRKEPTIPYCKQQNVIISPSQNFLDENSVRNLYTRQRKSRRNSTKAPRQIAGMSVPVNPHVCNVVPPTHHSFIERPHRVQHKSSPINFLQPIVGELKESLEHLENNINQVGDHWNHTKVCCYGEPYRKVCPMELPNTQQIYATATNLDKLKDLFSCQHPHRNENEKLSFCSCNNCEMIGVVMDSQKRPFMYPTGPKKPASNHGTSIAQNDQKRTSSKTKHSESPAKSPNYDYETLVLMRELSKRLGALERRFTDHEKRVVSKVYFKKIVKRIIESTQRRPSHAEKMYSSSTVFKDTRTQYSCEVHKLEKEAQSKKNVGKDTKYRNVQIQQNERHNKRHNYIVNPVMVSPVMVNQETNVTLPKSSNLKNLGTSPVKVLSDLIWKEVDAKTSNNSKKASENDNKSALETFLRWGEEIIKPGFDLKTKILALLEDQLKNFRSLKPDEPKVVKVDRSTEKDSFSSRSHNTDFKRSEFKKSNETNDKQSSSTGTSNRTLKKMLNLMSEKIYTDHVKPAVDAIKQETQSINSSGITYMHNIKKAIDKAVNEVNQVKDASTQNTGFAKSDWKKDFLEPLEVPSSIKSNEDTKKTKKVAQVNKKSGIPVRVGHTITVETVTSVRNQNRGNQNSCISNFKVQEVTTSDKFLKKNYKRQQKLTHSQKEEKVHTNLQPVQVKYMSSRIKCWNDDSTPSPTVISSQDSLA